jgi:hypothetical protein
MVPSDVYCVLTEMSIQEFVERERIEHFMEEGR